MRVMSSILTPLSASRFEKSSSIVRDIIAPASLRYCAEMVASYG
jgi:hypothetical protein